MITWTPPRLTAPRTVEITPRQVDVLNGICKGHTNAQIGRRLGIREATVKTHVRRLLVSICAHDRAHAAFLAGSRQVTVIVKARVS